MNDYSSFLPKMLNMKQVEVKKSVHAWIKYNIFIMLHYIKIILIHNYATQT